MKHKMLKIGVCLLALGLIGIIFCGINSKININQMTPADWKSCQHIDKIGDTTISKLESNAPYEQINTIAQIDGIGSAKMAEIKHHFCTYDTCRFEIFLIFLASSVVAIALGAMIIKYVMARRKRTEKTLADFVKQE